MTEQTLVDTPIGYYSMPTVHALSRELPGRLVNLPMPVCWDIEGQRRGATDDEWWISVDHEAVDFFALVFAVTRDAVTCTDCLEWIHA